MAKATKVKELATETNVLTTEQLDAVKQHVEQLGLIQKRIGELSVEKGIAMNQFMQVNASFGKVKQELEAEYGEVSINMETGEYTPAADGTN